MAYPESHMLLQWTAGFQPSATAPPYEIVVGGMKFAGAGLDATDTDATGQTLTDLLQTWWGQGASFIPSNCYLRTVKWNKIDNQGKYANQGATRLFDIDPTPGTKSPAYPTQIALVSSWETAKARGRAHSGRTYWPTGVSISASNNQLFPADAKTFADQCLRLVGTLNSVFPQSSSAGVRAVVMSKLGAGATNTITGVRVGTRFDVQRRRANSMTDVYQEGSTS